MNETQINFIGAGTTIKGKIITNDDVRVDGVVEGDIETKTKVIVGENGTVNGEINANSATISGLIDGSVITKESITLMKNSKVSGNVSTKNLVVETGAFVNGNIKMNSMSAGIDNGNSKPPSKPIGRFGNK